MIIIIISKNLLTLCRKFKNSDSGSGCPCYTPPLKRSNTIYFTIYFIFRNRHTICLLLVLLLNHSGILIMRGVVTVLLAIGIKEDVSLCWRIHTRALMQRNQQDSCSSGCLLHIMAYLSDSPPPALYSPVRYVLASPDTSLVTRLPPQP